MSLMENTLIRVERIFLKTLEVSCFSLTNNTKTFEPLINDNGSILTLTYGGSERVIPNYNVMGVAKAALESSVRYLAVDLGDRGIELMHYRQV